MAMKTTRKTVKQKTKVFIIDDHPIVRYGITRILNNEPDMIVCGDADNAAEGMDAIDALHPNIVIVDISLKGMDGLQLTRNIRSQHPSLPILILSMHDERMYAHKALRAGARGYVMKEESSEKLVTALRQILSGDIYVSEDVKKNVLHAYAGKEEASDTSVINKLSSREREVFLLIGTGQTSKLIAGKLCLSIKTIETHRSRIKQKLGLDTAAKLTMAAMEWARRENLVPILA
jgi:DNA-binding NarL/FixJ family response regulator